MELHGITCFGGVRGMGRPVWLRPSRRGTCLKMAEAVAVSKAATATTEVIRIGQEAVSKAAAGNRCRFEPCCFRL